MIRNNIKIITATLVFFTFQIKSSDFSFWLPEKPNLTFFNGEQIKLNQDSYQKFIERWQNVLTNSWNKFYLSLEQEVCVTAEAVDKFMQDSDISKIYIEIREKELQKLNECTLEEDIDPEVLTFIKRIVQKYCTKQNIKIILSPNINTITATFGSDNSTHYIVCHSAIYSKEHIKNYYESKANSNGIFYIDQSQSKFRFIELSNFLTIGLIEAATHIEHQSNFFTFIISNLKNSDKCPSVHTLKFCWQITEIRSIIEAILQSKNPLETAIFIGKSKLNNEKEKLLWKKLIKELAQCYEQESLNIFKKIIYEMKTTYKK